jgi:hypothetical protein
MLSFKTNSSQQHRLIPQEREKITLGQLILAGAFILLSFSSCTVALSNKNLSEQRITNVQLADGTAILVQQKPSHYRDPNLIKEFTKQWVSLMFSWNSKLPGSDQPDPGVKTANNKKVPVTSWGASLMMDSTFAQGFLEELTHLIPDKVFSGSLQSAASVRYLSEPKPINQNTWEVNVVAERILYDTSTQTQQPIIPFNKTFTIKAVEIPTSPLKDKANTLEKTVYKMRSSGLEIISIVDYNP